jgi:hypothetical protein
MFTDVVAKPRRVAWPDEGEEVDGESGRGDGGAGGSTYWRALS